MVNLDILVINVIVSTIIISPVLWLSGRIFVGGEKAKFMDAVLTVVIGSVIGAFFGAFFSGIIATIIQLIIWLALVRHFFDCGWLRALGISIVAVIIFIVVAIILGVVGLALFPLII